MSALVLVNGGTNTEYLRVDLSSAEALDPGAYLVVHSSNLVIAPTALSLLFPGSGDQAQNGSPDGIALIQTNPPTVLDALSYEGAITSAQIVGFASPVSLVEGTALSASVADSNTIAGSLARFRNGADTNNAISDWMFTTTPTPGAANQ